MAGNSRRIWRKLGGGIAAVLLLIATLLFGYVSAAAIGSAIPVNGAWKKAEAGVRIYVADNGIHTDLVLPMVAEGIDWRPLLDGKALGDPNYARHSHVMLGWGDRDFYLNTPTWSDVSARRVLRAMWGSDTTVMHVVHVPEPGGAPHIRAIMLTPDEYRRLAAFVRESFAIAADGRGEAVRGYGKADAFYTGRGTYSAVNSCNNWTGSALRAAGVRMGAWTPMPFGVMQWL